MHHEPPVHHEPPEPDASRRGPESDSARDFRYKAFISYSHRDEKWARWLHRALETYRVPKHWSASKRPWA